MNTILYVVVRYRPLSDTGEFANVGVICFSENKMDIRYKLAPARYARVTQFFDNVAPDSYANAMTFLKDELRRVVEFARGDRQERAETAFSFFTRKREGVIQFSHPRSILGEEIDLVTSQLYDRLVRRIESGQPQREAGLAQSIRRELRAANIRSFRAKQIEDNIMPVRLPLVSGKSNPYVIKPIAFDQKSTVGMLDHAALWHDRFKYFIDKGVFSHDRVLLPIEKPNHFEDDSFEEAFKLAESRITSLPVSVIRLGAFSHSHEAIVNFAIRGDAQHGGFH